MVFDNPFAGSINKSKDLYYADLVATIAEQHHREEIATKIRRNYEFRYRISRLLETHLCNWRKDIKILVQSNISAYYALVPSTANFNERITHLKTSSSYIYPGDIMTSINKSAPYQNRIFANITRYFLFRQNHQTVSTLMSYFAINHPDGVKHAIPSPFIALVATAIYAGILDLELKSKRSLPFETDFYLDTYMSHIGTLQALKSQYPTLYSKITEELYTNAIIGIPFTLENQNQGVQNILDGMDLEGQD
ncbi:hypothetical protein QCA50_016679 [Cerrena zonata]|uniref:DUF6532 domain-containing protein n=1 Tax=Cerrena zonata TaxID=2478898 RepID=A0AAW0FTY2_9APHY